MLDLSAVHRCRGLWVSYVLKCEGDEESPYYVYVGVSQDVELRMLAHTGIREFEQAEFTKRHPVIDLLSVRVHENEQEAIVAEVATLRHALARRLSCAESITWSPSCQD